MPKQVTNLCVPLQRSEGRAQMQNPYDTKRLLSLLVIRAINLKQLESVLVNCRTFKFKFYANVR